ncbi:MAG: T9SS type A sorting domain-containing protein [Breznakibacter sp.]
MKTKKLSLLFALGCFACSWAFAAVPHGSIKGTNQPLYPQGVAGGDVSAEAKATTLDFKVVTLNGQSWVYLKFTGPNNLDTGADWTSQFRYWNAENVKTENNLTSSKNAATKEITGTTAVPAPSPLKISFFQAITEDGFSETALFLYDMTVPNSPVDGDTEAPALTGCQVEPAETSASLTFTASDNSGDLFFHITDSEHQIETVALSGQITLGGLTASTTYNLTITPIDFNGNEGTPLQKQFTTKGLVQIVSGIAKEIKFVLKSSASELEYYYEFTNPSNTFRDAALKITPSGGTTFEVKPTVSPDGKYCHGKTSDAYIAGKVLALNLCYFVFEPGDPVWENYVVDNTTVTDGPLAGTPIMHQMGDAAPSDNTPPTLNSATLADATTGYLKLSLNGTDDQAVYYEIAGAGETVNAFRTGDYYLTNILPGNTYNLIIKAKDLAGNVSDNTIELKAKTASARSNVADGDNLNYNTIVKPAGIGGEIATIIQRNGQSLTIGCTTLSPLLGDAANRTFHPKESGFTPTVTINNVNYPLERTPAEEGLEGITAASVTFNDKVGDVDIVDGNVLNLQWSVFWTQGNGNFFTGTFTYKLGDEGQTDTDGPSAPQLTLENGLLTWPSCADLLSGTKWYEISIGNSVPTMLFDLGEAGFTVPYTPLSTVTVTAVDFAGNKSETATFTDIQTEAKTAALEKIRVTVSNGTISVGNCEPYKLILANMQGKTVKQCNRTSTLDAGSLPKGIYLLTCIDGKGNVQTIKINL